ncbi:MAG: phosphoribosylformylglycinamidine synthase subunit PurQ [Candidatus Caldatribacteriota bacterium]
MKFGIIQFPGSNCDFDCYYALKNIIKVPVEWIWHKQDDLNGFDCIVLPGGFTYGDYLRVGAIARYSPVMSALTDFSRAGGLVIGICNGFQVLTEAKLLPGTLTRNKCLHFICKQQTIRVEEIDTPFTIACKTRKVLQIPIAHGEGCYYTDKETLEHLEQNKQIIFRYCDADGKISDKANPNGSLNNIAGICNKERNVIGLMPHPERSIESCLGSDDGRLIFESIVNHLKVNCF